jgi:hypothetical protein
MKNFLHICLLAASLTTATNTGAQTTYTISSSSNYSANKIPSQCANCTINIASDVTLTIDQDIYLQNVAFNGGEKGSSIIVDSKKVTFWSNGSFSNVTVTLKNTANLVNSGTLTISNSDFTFSNTSFATVYSSIDMSASSMKFLDNAYMEATGGTFSLKTSSLTAGDGSKTSKAYIKFNGASLSINDNISFVTVANSNNSYFNWSKYSANGKSIKTTDNKLNCGAKSQNACSSPSLYGPATLSAAGVSSSSTLPVKLSAFAVKLNGGRVELTWTTEQEINANRFEIERSADGLNWKSIGKVNAKGNTTEATKYAFSDASFTGGTISYRLKMIDLDESSEYSPIRSVKIAVTETHEMTIYPNPAADYVVISSKYATSSNVTIQLISMNGQVLKQVNSSSSTTNLTLSAFHAGNYIVRVSDSTGAAQNFKLLIAK